MKVDIRLGTVGKIIHGEDSGSYIKIIHDELNTGGYLIITSNHLNFDTTHDNWVENLSNLQNYFIECKWIIDWIDN